VRSRGIEQVTVTYRDIARSFGDLFSAFARIRTSERKTACDAGSLFGLDAVCERVRVADSGAGVDEALAVGMGLTASRAIIDAHGGSL